MRIEDTVKPTGAERATRRPRAAKPKLAPVTETEAPENLTPFPVASEPEPQGVPEAFEAFGLSDEVLRALAEMGYREPTEIQVRVLPLLLDGADVIGQAQTGTGKTSAFGIPLIEGIDEDLKAPQALVLAPTRELAMQIAEELRRLAQFIPGITIVTLYGGAGYGRQFEDLKDGAQVVVGTPGRIIDHLQRGTLKLGQIDYLILDEADRMLDMGFLPDVERILRRTPRDRQTALFSATVPTVIRILSRRHMHHPVSVQVKPEEPTVEGVEQIYYEVAQRDKIDAMLWLLEHDPPEQAMIFRQTKIGVDRLVSALRRHGLPAEAIHGDMSQSIREKVLGDFRAGKLKYLVATDVASRGLDIPDVSHIFNYDIPEDAEAYVHRIGRTARAGRTGTAVTFMSEWDMDRLGPIQKIVGERLERRVLPMYQQA